MSKRKTTATSDDDEPAPKKGRKLTPAEKDEQLLEKLLKANKNLDTDDNDAVLGVFWISLLALVPQC